MSHEKSTERFSIEAPSAAAYLFAKYYESFGFWRKHIKLTSNGTELVPMSGPVSAQANHRNDKYDISATGLALKKRRTFYAPAKIELNKGIKGKVMEGGGALFFVREDPEERKRIAKLMDRHIKLGHMVVIMAEGTSKITGQALAEMDRSPLKLAIDNGLEQLILIGIGGTDTPMDPHTFERTGRPKHIHVEIGSIAIPSGLSTIKDRKDFHHEVVMPSHQEIVDIAYQKVAA